MATKKVPPMSTRKRSLNKTKIDVRRTRKKQLEDKLAENNDKSTVVTRRQRNMISKETNNDKNKTVTKKIQKAGNKSSGLRQLSLKESFSSQPISKRLRARPNKEQNNGKTVQNCLSPRSQRSVVLLSKISTLEKDKKPIYTRTNFSDDSTKDKCDVYNFEFDLNDTTEKIPKKRRKRVMKTSSTKNSKKPGQVKFTIQKNVPKKVLGTTDNDVSKRNISKKKIIKKSVLKTSKENALKQNASASQVKRSRKSTRNIKVTSDKKPINETEEKPVKAPQNDLSENIAEIAVGNDTPLHLSLQETSTPEVQTSEIKSPHSDKNKIKPIVKSIEKVTDTKIVVVDPAKSTTENPLSLRPINAPNNKPIVQYKYKHMTDHSLLNKSLSPITKQIHNFDVGSPWRPPPISSFSHVKNLFQSTPAVKANDEKLAQQMNTKNVQATATSLDKNINNLVSQKNRNTNIEKERIPTPLSRRFGTEITNVDHSAQSLALNGSKYNDIMEDKENAVPNYQTPKKSKARRMKSIKRTLSLQRVATVQSFQKKEDLKPELLSNTRKEITSESNKISEQASDLQEPEIPEPDMQINDSVDKSESSELQGDVITNGEKIFKRSNDQLILKELEPQAGSSGLQKDTMVEHRGILKESNYRQKETVEPQPGPSGLQKNIIPNEKRILKESNYQQKENIEPQPGPSGLQKENIVKSEKVLRQSNLSSFLNLPEMPESSIIRTAHGIFDDAHSTPVNGKPLRKLKKPETEVDNAFGFAESDSDLDISPIDPEGSSENVKKVKPKSEALLFPARLSIGEIQNKLLLQPARGIKEKNKETDKNPKINAKVDQKVKKQLVDAVSFSDTFDVLSESEETSNNIAEVPLFVDLEPTHFTEPPKRSYKRKREVRFSFSEDSDVEDADIGKPETKRKKKREKINKEEEKRLKEWVQTVNQTFSEIDQYDLVIE